MTLETSMEANLNIPTYPTQMYTTNTVDVGYSINLSADGMAFENSLQNAAFPKLDKTNAADTLTQSLIAPLAFIDNEASLLADYALRAVSSDKELSPSEIVMLTARSQEFMFHSQLTANIANRTADGLQQLFRQQS